MEKLNEEITWIPFAVSPGDGETDPESAEIEVANFEVVWPARIP
jgi:hypothetical protein